MVTVIVKRPNIRYRIPGINKGRAFSPEVGDRISLEKTLAKKEIKTGNVRLPLEEEKKEIEKIKKKKKKKIKKEE